METITVNLTTAAKLLGVNADRIRPLLEDGSIPAFRFGSRDWVIPRKLLQQYVEERSIREAEERKCQKKSSP